MSILARRITNIKPSATLSVTHKAQELKAEGNSIISLSAGEPDFDTPKNIQNFAINAIHAGYNKYTAVDGISDLKTAVAKKFKRDNNLDYENNEIIIGSGAKHILFNTIMSTVNPGDEVIIPAPYWPSYPAMVTLAEGTPVIARCSEQDHAKLTPENLERHLTKKTKWLMLNSPNNPTGGIYNPQELRALGAVLAAHPNVYIMSDDIYEHIRYNSEKYYTFAEAVPSLKSRVVVINGVSKAYAMTGWRIGYAGGPKNIIQAMSKLQSQSTSHPTSVAQYAAVEALNGAQDCLKTYNTLFKQRRDLVINMLNSIAGLECPAPPGAFYVYPSCKKLIGKTTPKGQKIKSDIDFATYLLEEAGVAVVPGVAFGLSPYFRLSYAAHDNILISGCNRIKVACEKLT